MRLSVINRIKHFNWVSVVQSCWVMLAVFISIGEVKSEGLNDPTKPPEAVVQLMPEANNGDVSEWKLQGLKVAAKQGAAVVDGHWVTVGKDYQGYRLVKVTKTQAIFTDKTGNKKVLNLGVNPYQTATKKPKRTKNQVKKL